MEQEFKIIYRHSGDNLHVRLHGDFTGICAWELFKLLRQHDGSRKVFVNTHHLSQVTDEGINLFKLHMKRKLLPRQGLYFKGKKGFKIGPDGSLVLIYKKGGPPECRSKKLKHRFKCIPGNKAESAERTISLVKDKNRVLHNPSMMKGKCHESINHLWINHRQYGKHV